MEAALSSSTSENLDSAKVKELVEDLKQARKEEPTSSASSASSQPSLVTLGGKLQRKQQHLEKLIAQRDTISKNWTAYKTSMQAFLQRKFDSAQSAMRTTAKDIAEARMQVLLLQQQLQSHQLATGEAGGRTELPDAHEILESAEKEGLENPPNLTLPQLLEDDVDSDSDKERHGMDLERIRKERSRSPKVASTPRKSRKAAAVVSPSQAPEVMKGFH